MKRIPPPAGGGTLRDIFSRKGKRMEQPGDLEGTAPDSSSALPAAEAPAVGRGLCRLFAQLDQKRSHLPGEQAAGQGGLLRGVAGGADFHQ